MTRWRRKPWIAATVLGLLIACTIADAETSSDQQNATEPPAAAAKYHRVLLRRPDPGYLYDRFMGAWLDESSHEELEAFLVERAKASSDAADGLLLAFYYSKQGDDLKAIERFRATLEGSPGSASAWYEKAVLEARTLDFETALSDLDAAGKADPDDELSVKIAKLRGQLLVRERRQEEALQVFNELLAARPDDAELAEDVIELEVDEQLYDEAIAQSQRLIQQTKDPYRRVLRTLRVGDIHQLAGRRDEAMAVYRGVLGDIGMGSWLEREVLAQIERAYRKQDDVASLKDEYEKLLEEHPRRVGVHRGYASVLVDLGDADGAIECFKKVLEITPGDRANQEAFVQLCLRADKTAEARKRLKALVEQHPRDGELWLQLAELRSKTKDPAAAAAAVDEFLAVSDKSEYAHLRAARLLERLELVDGAREKYALLTDTFPDSPTAKESRAAFLYKADDKEQAIELWLAAAEGDDPQQAVRVARALASRQEHEAAHGLLDARREAFASDSLFLGQLIDEKLALEKAAEAVPLALRRVDLAEAPRELEEAISQAARVIARAEVTAATAEDLSANATTPQRVCLLSELHEQTGDVQAADSALEALAAAGDPLAIGQQVRLAQRRRDWDAAAAAVRRLIDLPGGRKSVNVRRLVECYQRAYRHDDALKWIPEWKKLSPGGTSPWLTESRLLLIEGEKDAALEVLREAMREFEGAVEVRDTLARTYESVGKLADAERIYWRAFEDTEDALGKVRVVEQLARLAQQQGKTESFVANLQERRRENRTAIEPLMALAAAHRVAGDYEKRLQVLAEAAKLRPDDLSLLRQIATIQEQEGDWEAARDTLQRAAPLDKTDTVERHLVRLLLRWGNTQEAYARLYRLSGGEDAESKDLEDLADAMMSVGDWDQAARFLEPITERRPNEYRLRYLRAIALEEYAEPLAAAQEFLRLLNTNESEAAKNPPPAAGSMTANSYYDQLKEAAPPGVVELMTAVQSSRMAYQYRQMRGRNRYAGRHTQATVNLPASLENARQHALAHLGSVMRYLEEGEAETIRDEITRMRLPEADALLSIGGETNNQAAMIAGMLERRPERESVMAFALLWGGQNHNIDNDFYRRSRDAFADRWPQLALLAAIKGAMASEEMRGEEDIALAEQLLRSEDEPNAIMLMQVFQAIRNSSGVASVIPERLQELIRRRLVEWYPKVRDSQPYGQHLFSMAAGVLKSSPDPTEFVRLLEEEVVRQKSDGAKHPHAAAMHAHHLQQNFLAPPSFPPVSLQDFPLQVVALLGAQQSNNLFFNADPRDAAAAQWSDEAVDGLLPSVADPTLRVLLANHVGREKVVESEIAALETKEGPTIDDCMIAAGWACQNDELEKALGWLQKARFLPMERAVRNHIDSQLAGVAQRIANEADPDVLSDAEKGGDVPDWLLAGREAAMRLRQVTLQPNQRTQLGTTMELLGLEKEARRLTASAPANAAGSTATRVVLQSSGPTPQSQIDRLLAANKHEAAAKLLAQELRGMISQHGHQPGNRSYFNHVTREFRGRLNKLGLTDEVLAVIDPGDSRNPQRVVEFAEALDALGQSERALELWERALELRPREDTYRVKLMLASTDADRLEEATARFEEFKPGGAEELAAQILASYQNNYRDPFEPRWRRAELGIALFDHESNSPRADLAWAPLLRKNLSNPQHGNNSSMPSLYQRQGSNRHSDTTRENEERRRELHDRLCRKMLAHAALADEGFMGLMASFEASGGDLTDAPEYEQMARDVLMRLEGRPLSSAAFHRHTVHYNQSDLVAMRPPGEHLVWVCWREGDWSALEDEVLPHLRDHGRGDLARRLEAYRGLYEADAEGFAQAAREYLRRVPSGLTRYDVEEQPELLVIEAWRRRDFGGGEGADLDPLVTGWMKQVAQTARSTRMPPFVLDYAEGLIERDGVAAADAWLEHIAELFAGPREKRQDYIAKHFTRNQIQSGTPNMAIHCLGHMISEALKQPRLFAAATRLLNEGRVNGIVQNAEYAIQQGLQKALNDDSIDPVEFFEELGLLSDAPRDPTAGLATERFYNLLRSRLSRQGEREDRLVEALADRQPQTIGVLMLRSLARDADSDLPAKLLQRIGEQLDELRALETSRQTEIAKQIDQITQSTAEAALVKAKNENPAVQEASDWLEERLRQGGLAVWDKLRETKRFQELGVEGHQLDEWMARELTPLVHADPATAAEAFYKVIDLYHDAVASGSTHYYFGGNTELHLLQQLGYRSQNGDRGSLDMVRLHIALAHNKGAERFALSHNTSQRFFQAFRHRFDSAIRENRSSKGDNQPIQDCLRQLDDDLSGDDSPLLLAAMLYVTQRASHQDLESLQELLTNGADEGLANPNLVGYLQTATGLALDNKDRSQSKSLESQKPAPHHERVIEILSDKSLPLSARMTVASGLLHYDNDMMPIETARAVAWLGAEAFGGEIAYSYELERQLAENLETLLAESTEDEAALAFLEAWHQRFVRRPPSSKAQHHLQKPTEAHDASGLVRILAASYLIGDSASAHRLLHKYSAKIANRQETIALVAREGEIKRAAALAQRGWSNLPSTNLSPPCVHYDERIERVMPELIKAIGDRSLAYLIEASIARLPDPKGAEDAVRDERLSAVAERFEQADIKQPQMRRITLLQLAARDAALDQVAEPLREAVEQIDLVKLAELNVSDFDEAALLVARHAHWAARRGDPGPAAELITTLMEADTSRMWRLNNVMHQHGQSTIRLLAHQIRDYDAEACEQLAPLLRSLTTNDEWRNMGGNQSQELTMLTHLKAGLIDEYCDWLAGLEESSVRQFRQRGVYNDMWKSVEETLELKGEPLATRIDRLVDVIRMAHASGWVFASDPSRVSLRFRGGHKNFEPYKAFFSKEELPEAVQGVASRVPADGLTWLAGAAALKRSKQYAEAANAFEASADAAPSGQAVRAYLARLEAVRCYLQPGQTDKARKQIDELGNTPPPSDAAENQYDSLVLRIDKLTAERDNNHDEASDTAVETNASEPAPSTADATTHDEGGETAHDEATHDEATHDEAAHDEADHDDEKPEDTVIENETSEPDAASNQAA
ncbi:Tetratricopeptide repeat protein [Pseudobythopirellula maris]|uniref:Tetratricopeptide repeat protein n=1 Tax=Pseudobythopirellula maris TaxID=2527991 RepID=A0A5C5ZRL6_9BACT|nr:tetratricopeptide repeat protein [Pseudobythopirellula maris]TWT90192.1 Tetratricopeptide repeat protein [Pseudobythopirellula maris]